jgi:hypothetical protein
MQTSYGGAGLTLTAIIFFPRARVDRAMFSVVLNLAGSEKFMPQIKKRRLASYDSRRHYRAGGGTINLSYGWRCNKQQKEG